MTGGVTIAASTPAWNEPKTLLARNRASVAGVVDYHHVFKGGIRGLVDDALWASQSEMRQAGFRACAQWASKNGVTLDWIVQLDADEALVNGELLRPILARYPFRAYPIAYVQEDGQVTLAPFKVLRWPATLVACCEYVAWRDDERVWNLAGYAAPDALREPLLRLPFIYHAPGWRQEPARRVVRLSARELEVETRPPNAVQWALPPLTLSEGETTMKHSDDGSPLEHEKSDGDYYCPGCGTRYDTPGICTGTTESPHEAMNVTKTSDGAAEPTPAADATGEHAGHDGDGDAKPPARPKRSGSRKTSGGKKSATTAKKKTATRGRKR